MFCPTRRRCLRSARILQITEDSISLPSFLLPAFRATSTLNTRTFTSSARCASKIGRAALSVPSEVSFKVVPPPALNGKAALRRAQPMATVRIKGPLGETSMQIPEYMKIENAESKAPRLTVEDSDVRNQREMWGTVRAYLHNNIIGVSEGHTAILRLVGVGYRATIEDTAVTKQPEYPGQKFVNLKVGYSHPIELGVPPGVKASTPQPTRLLLEGVDKEVVMSFAAKIRKWRRPEPYKGKGIFVNGETIKLKNKKIK